MKRLGRVICVAALLTTAGSAVAYAQNDGNILPPGEGRDTVEALCSACHSIRLVAQQAMTRERWNDVIRQMVAKQGMPEPDPETREILLDYLGEHLDPEPRGKGGLSPFNRPAPLPQSR